MSKRCASPGCSNWAFDSGLCRSHHKASNSPTLSSGAANAPTFGSGSANSPTSSAAPASAAVPRTQLSNSLPATAHPVAIAASEVGSGPAVVTFVSDFRSGSANSPASSAAPASVAASRTQSNASSSSPPVVAALSYKEHKERFCRMNDTERYLAYGCVAVGCQGCSCMICSGGGD
jgi:hypothetical protein